MNHVAPKPESKREAFFADPGGFIQALLKGEETIKKVELASVRPYEISIEVSEDTLRQYDLTLREVATAVSRASLDLPSGSVRTDSGEIEDRARRRKYRGEEFREVTIKKLPDGSNLKLGQIASVIDGFVDIGLVCAFNGRPAVVLHVFRVAEQDTLAIAKLAREYVESLQKPEGVEIEVWNDASFILKGRLDLL